MPCGGGTALPGDADPAASSTFVQAEEIADAIRHLAPANNAQRVLQTKAVDLVESLLQARWISLATMRNSVPLPFLTVLLFWLAFIFMSFGLLTPQLARPDRTGHIHLSAGSAMFLILEMDSPFSGVIRVSADPLHSAIARLNR